MSDKILRPVIPISVRIEALPAAIIPVQYGLMTYYTCEACGGYIGRKDHFCRHCGYQLKKDEEIEIRRTEE